MRRLLKNQFLVTLIIGLLVGCISKNKDDKKNGYIKTTVIRESHDLTNVWEKIISEKIEIVSKGMVGTMIVTNMTDGSCKMPLVFTCERRQLFLPFKYSP